MTKEELRTEYVNKGWEVQPVDVFETRPDPDGGTIEVRTGGWNKVSDIEGKVKYDVNAVSPDNEFVTAQVVVTDDGGAGETAVALGAWKDRTPDFGGRLRTYLATVEQAAAVFAIAVINQFNADSVAECKAYMADGSVKTYAVKERNDTFDHKELI